MDFEWLCCIKVDSWVITNVPSGGDVDNGGGYAFLRAGCIRESSVLSAQYCCEHKTGLQSKVY